MSALWCTNCGAAVREEWAYCDMCGARRGADPVTSLIDLAAHAGMPVAAVLRVILREPASAEAKEKVGAAVAALGLPDYPRPDGQVDVVPAGGNEISAEKTRALEELFADLLEGLDRERRERIDDVAVTTQLFREGWTSVDRRLGRLEKMIERIERQTGGDDAWLRRSRRVSSNGGE